LKLLLGLIDAFERDAQDLGPIMHHFLDGGNQHRI
jgi:hypothetical protein